MKRTLGLVLLGLALFILSAPVFAGELSSVLEAVLNETDSDQPVKAIVIMKEQVNVHALSATMNASGVTLAQRHESVVNALQDTAISQTPLLEWTMSAKDAGQILEVKPLWIANMIAVEATPQALREIAGREDVAEVELDYPIELIKPVGESVPSSASGKGIEGGVISIGANQLWAIGFDGTGQIVSHLDTGVDASHPALQNWHGSQPGIPSTQAWFDPVTSTTVPFDAWEHGTHTMGTICGDDGGLNQIGVAPGATWISAGVIDRAGGSQTYSDALLSLQWSTDPDGDSSTFDDVPCVSSNSWGLSPMWHGYPACDSTLWDAMDGAEAAGVVVVFAAGNEGNYGGGTIRIPADRITTNYNAFAVGALNQDNTTIAYFSSLGPSGCDNMTFKPEVSAVGMDVNSAMPGGGYQTMSGTSMATPHVAGVVALLRQAFPGTTVEQIKEAIYLSTFDLGAVGEDNTFGMGRVDALAAYNYLKAICDVDGDNYSGAVCGGDDCNDGDVSINPGAEELCDGIDNNCDDLLGADEVDADADQYMVCEGDCNDESDAVYPGAEEVCDGIDNDCDEALGEGEVDADGDQVMVCEDDCDDSDETVYPGAEELCTDDVDNNCDGDINENCGDDDDDDDDDDGCGF